MIPTLRLDHLEPFCSFFLSGLALKFISYAISLAACLRLTELPKCIFMATIHVCKDPKKIAAQVIIKV